MTKSYACTLLTVPSASGYSLLTSIRRPCFKSFYRDNMGSSSSTDSFWIVSWNQSPWHILTAYWLLSHLTTAHLDPRGLHVKMQCFPPFSEAFSWWKWLKLSGRDAIHPLVSPVLHAKDVSMSPFGPFLDMLCVKNFTHAQRNHPCQTRTTYTQQQQKKCALSICVTTRHKETPLRELPSALCG